MVKSLQEMYGEEEEEATKLFRATTNSMMMYNKKLEMITKTRKMIEANMGEDDFKTWNKKFIWQMLKQ